MDDRDGIAIMTLQSTGEGTLSGPPGSGGPCPIPGHPIPDYSTTQRIELTVSGASVTADYTVSGGIGSTPDYMLGSGWDYSLRGTRSGSTITGTFTFRGGVPSGPSEYTFIPPTSTFTVTKTE